MNSLKAAATGVTASCWRNSARSTCFCSTTGLAVLDDRHRRDLLEVLDDRHGNRSTLVTSQLPVDHWHDAIGDPTLADAILDRLVHNAYQLKLTGESIRKKRRQLTEIGKPE